MRRLPFAYCHPAELRYCFHSLSLRFSLSLRLVGAKTVDEVDNVWTVIVIEHNLDVVARTG